MVNCCSSGEILGEGTVAVMKNKKSLFWVLLQEQSVFNLKCVCVCGGGGGGTKRMALDC